MIYFSSVVMRPRDKEGGPREDFTIILGEVLVPLELKKN